jgi:4,4'-diaponeurosporenoate glycosyltransferase
MHFIFLAIVILGLLSGYFLLSSPEKFSTEKDNELPKVSIIIPARNEENRLPHLLRSLNDQPKDLIEEIIVVDDQSTDNTAEIARKFHAKVIFAKPLPKGWFGKPWACYQGAEQAKANVLLFLDADTIIKKDGLRKIIQTFIKDRTPLSIQPYHVTKTFYEQFSLMFNLIVVMTSGQASLFKKRLKVTSFFGPCQIVRKEDYQSIGGHEAVKNKILEDIALGEAYQQHTKKPVRAMVGKGVISFRMYSEGFNSLVEGWTKNFSTGAKLIPGWMMVVISFWITGLFISFLSGIAPFMWTDYAYPIGYLMSVFFLYLMARKVGNFSFLLMFIYPLYILFFVWLFIRSSNKTTKQKKVQWKGRDLDL